MSFSSILREMTDSVKGSMGAAIAGADGIILEEYIISPKADMQSLGAEYGNVFKEVNRASSSLELGETKEFSVSSEAGELIMRKINEDYLLALLLAPGSNRGKGRYKVRTAAFYLKREL